VKSSKRLKQFKNDFLRADPAELAQNLTLLESRLYSKIRPIELITWARSPGSRDGAKNLLRFCETSDQLAAWVKHSILSVDTLGRRADVINHWIRVAEVEFC
jgi:son of sevenless